MPVVSERPPPAGVRATFSAEQISSYPRCVTVPVLAVAMDAIKVATDEKNTSVQVLDGAMNCCSRRQDPS